MTRLARRKRQVLKDFIYVAISVSIAIILVKSNIIFLLTLNFQNLGYFGSFFAGMFFTSIFTTAPSIAILGELSKTNSIWIVTIVGALGAVFGDYIIFRFVKDRVSEDLGFLLEYSKFTRWKAIFRTKLFHYILPFLGAIVIASPFPDEIGLAMLGLSKMKNKTFFIVTFIFNALGILLISFIANS